MNDEGTVNTSIWAKLRQKVLFGKMENSVSLSVSLEAVLEGHTMTEYVLNLSFFFCFQMLFVSEQQVEHKNLTTVYFICPHAFLLLYSETLRTQFENNILTLQ